MHLSLIPLMILWILLTDTSPQKIITCTLNLLVKLLYGKFTFLFMMGLGARMFTTSRWQEAHYCAMNCVPWTEEVYIACLFKQAKALHEEQWFNNMPRMIGCTVCWKPRWRGNLMFCKSKCKCSWHFNDPFLCSILWLIFESVMHFLSIAQCLIA